MAARVELGKERLKFHKFRMRMKEGGPSRRWKAHGQQGVAHVQQRGGCGMGVGV